MMALPQSSMSSVELAKLAQAEERAAAERAVPGLKITDDGALVHRPRPVLIFPQESPVERAAHSAACALDDLEAAIVMAKSRRELVLLREMAAEIETRAEKLERAARLFDEHFPERP